jgi:4-amino-4-deoxy-L-arabinose transferase-like glycosyltransferase
VLGVSDGAARVPAAVDATLLVLAVYLFFRRFRRGVEVDAALITASSAGVVGYAHAASMDMALAAAFSIGMLSWWAWRETDQRIYLALFYFLMALGMLAKGPVAPFLAAVVIATFAAATRQLRVVIKTLWLPGHGTSRCRCGIRSSFASLFCSTIWPAFPAISTITANRSGITCPSRRSRLCPGWFS